MATGQDERQTPVVFLLGAGASVDAGCPTVEQLVETFDAFLEERGAHREKRALEAIKGLLAEFSTSRRGEVVVDVELLLATIRQLADRETNPLSAFVRQWNREVGKHTKYLPRLDELLQEHIRRECTVESDKVQYLWPISEFVDHYGHLDVFSLNYDATVEIVCQQKEVPYTDGFKLYWDPGDFGEARNRLRLFKLHGSLLWYVTHGIPRKLVKIPIRASAPEGVQFFTDEKVSHVLIYPTLAKEQHVEPYATLMGEFRRALAGADVLVAVGCSFRDEYIKQVIIERMLQNPDLQLVVVDPKAAHVVSRSDRLLGPEWRFEEVADRVSLVHESAEEALTGHRLLDHVRGVEGLTTLWQGYRSSELRGDPESALRASAWLYLDALVQCRHVGAVAKVIRAASSGTFLMSTLAQMATEASEQDVSSCPLAAVNMLIAGLAQDDTYRTRAAAWLRGHMRWVLEYVVWRSNGGYTAILAGERQPPVDSARVFFSSHADRVRSLLQHLTPWALATEFGGTSRMASDALALAEDVELSLRYFENTSADDHHHTFQSTLGDARFPRGRDDDVMRELGARFQDGLPRSLLRIVRAG